jgi:hypothetical protein
MTVSGANISILRHNHIDKSFARELILTLGYNIDWPAGSLIIKAIPLLVLTGLVSFVYTSATFIRVMQWDFKCQKENQIYF